MGHWEALAADTRLGLESKLEAAAVEKRGKSYQPPEELRDLPKGESLPLRPINCRSGPHTACISSPAHHPLASLGRYKMCMAMAGSKLPKGHVYGRVMC